MNYQKEITKNLKDYLTNGVMDSTVVEQFDGVGFPAEGINGKRFQFITKYEDVDSITDDTIIPVLLVTLPDKQMEGKVVYKGRLTDLRTLTIDDKYVNKVNFFVIPQVTLLSGNRLGSIEFNIRVDFNSDFDVYGFVADEISQLLRLMYWKKRSGDYYSMKTSDDRPLFFVPTSIENFNNGAIFARIKHNLAIKACHFG